MLELYKTLHPEDADTTEDKLDIVTIDNVMTDNLYNDLGLMAGNNKLLLLLEAQDLCEDLHNDWLSIRMERPSARPATGWYTGAIAPAAAGANGAARWPAAKQMPVRAGINAPNPHTGGASIQNLTGMRAFSPPVARGTRNIKKFIKTAHPVNG